MTLRRSPSKVPRCHSRDTATAASSTDFAGGLRNVIDWYAEHRDWWVPAKEATEARYRAQGQ